MAKSKAKYVDGFVLVVPKKRTGEYRKIAKQAGRIWIKHGALDYKECVLDDAKPQFAELFFPKMAKTKPGETVWFSYIEYKSKKHRDQVNARVMKEMKERADSNAEKEMPFDMKRMAYGGFKVEVSS